MTTTHTTVEQHLSNINFPKMATDAPAGTLVLVFSWKVQEDETTVTNYAAAIATAEGCREAGKYGVFVPNLEIILEDRRFQVMRSTVVYSADYVAARVLGLWEDSTGIGNHPAQNAQECAERFLCDLRRAKKPIEMTVTAYTEQDQQDD